LTLYGRHSSVNTSRADLCELLAIKLLSAYGTAPNSFELLHVLTATFNPFTGATVESFAEEEGVDAEALEELEVFGKDLASNALELGIFSKAKRFVKSPLGTSTSLLLHLSISKLTPSPHTVQQVIKAIYEGEVIYSPESTQFVSSLLHPLRELTSSLLHSALIQDNYKDKPVVEIYDWRRRPFLDHHRLRVPHIRARLEYGSFAIMLALFLVVQSSAYCLFSVAQLNQH
jgi:hypothetical protein